VVTRSRSAYGSSCSAGRSTGSERTPTPAGIIRITAMPVSAMNIDVPINIDVSIDVGDIAIDICAVDVSPVDIGAAYITPVDVGAVEIARRSVLYSRLHVATATRYAAATRYTASTPTAATTPTLSLC